VSDKLELLLKGGEDYIVGDRLRHLCNNIMILLG
jgi:hypothetical protein